MTAPLPPEIQPWQVKAAGTGPAGNEQHVYRFTNGYGASVVRGPNTYGGKDGRWELAVLRFEGDTFDLTYETPITDDVLGYLDIEDVAAALVKIASLTDPPEVDPEDAEARRIAETFADAADEYRAIEAGEL